MTKQHFEEIAAAIARQKLGAERGYGSGTKAGIAAVVTLESLAYDLAELFQDRKRSFDHDRFIVACGFEVE